MSPFRVNLGGEGEVPGVVNQQGPWVAQPGWAPSRFSLSFEQLVTAGHVLLVCENLPLALPDECVDKVITNNVPINRTTWQGAGIQSNEIERILKSGGVWIRDGLNHYTKP